VLKMLGSKAHALLGVDVSSSAIKIVELILDRGTYHVLNYIRWPLSEVGMAHDSMHIDYIALRLKTLLTKKVHLSTKYAALAVPTSSTITKTIQAHHSLHESEIEALVRLEVDKYCASAAKQIYFDFCILGPSIDNPSLLDIRFIASRSQQIRQYIEILQKAGLKLKILDTEADVIARVINLLIKSWQNGHHFKTIAMFDIGVRYLRLYVLHEKKIIFSHEETLIEKIPVAWHASLLTLVKRALQFYFSNNGHNVIDEIYLAGGRGNSSELVNFFQTHIDIPTQILNPFSTMTYATHIDQKQLMGEAPMFMTACGLALRVGDDKY
jgi:type IV pilus assembly protein PilM